MIAAVTHRGTWIGPALGNALFVWIGTRSYGLYLYHWPIYQGIRRVAGNTLSVPEFAVAMAATLVVTELSYRLVETPIRRGTYKRWWRGLQRSGDDGARRLAAVTGAVVIAVVVFAARQPADGAGRAERDRRRPGRGPGVRRRPVRVDDDATERRRTRSRPTTVAPTSAAPSTARAVDRRGDDRGGDDRPGDRGGRAAADARRRRRRRPSWRPRRRRPRRRCPSATRARRRRSAGTRSVTR